MSSFAKVHNDYHVTPDRDLYLTVIPPGNYTMHHDERTGAIFFRASDPFAQPGKVYGKLNAYAARILATFQDRPNTTGVLLYGVKGSGKSQLARLVCSKGAGAGIPTLILNTAIDGKLLATALETFNQPVIVFIDEFEKLYRLREHQEGLLTVLDGTLTGQVLFILTCNDRFQVSSNMANRPGRLYYSMEFSGVDEGFVREYAQANLLDQTHVERVTQLSTAFSLLTFDMLKAWVEEINRYGEDPVEALSLLNVSPVDQRDHYASGSPYNYSVTVTDTDGRVYDPPEHPSEISNDPLRDQAIHVWLTKESVRENEDSPDITFYRENLYSANAARGVYQYQKGGATMTLTRKMPESSAASHAFKLMNVL